MNIQTPLSDAPFLQQIIITVLAWPWVEYLAAGMRLLRKLSRGMASEGLYFVEDYKLELELLDNKGRKAKLIKNENVRYLQNNIIAYQDQAWGDGDTLVNYKCSPGFEADRYRVGYKTMILISLREPKHRGDRDEFILQREIRNGFLNKTEHLSASIDHRTKQLQMKVLFPESRPPTSLRIMEQGREKVAILGHECLRKLPDGRWMATWLVKHPRLNEDYVLLWDW